MCMCTCAYVFDCGCVGVLLWFVLAYCVVSHVDGVCGAVCCDVLM